MELVNSLLDPLVGLAVGRCVTDYKGEKDMDPVKYSVRLCDTDIVFCNSKRIPTKLLNKRQTLFDGKVLWGVDKILPTIRELRRFDIPMCCPKVYTLVLNFLKAILLRDYYFGVFCDDISVANALGIPQRDLKLEKKYIAGTKFMYSQKNLMGSQDYQDTITSGRNPQKLFVASGIVWIHDVDSAIVGARMLTALSILIQGHIPCTVDEMKKGMKYLKAGVEDSKSSYTPITSNYLQVMSEVCESVDSVYVNPKYDGTPIWLYLSSKSLGMLYQPIKRRSGTKFRPVGVLTGVKLTPEDLQLINGKLTRSTSSSVEILGASKEVTGSISNSGNSTEILGASKEVTGSTSSSGNSVNIRENHEVAILCEKVGDLYYMVDTLLNPRNLSTYRERYELMVSLSNNLQRYGEFCKAFRLTEGGRLQGVDSAIPNPECLPMLMRRQSLSEATDGYIVYIDDKRPAKLKDMDHATVDLDFYFDEVAVADGKVCGKWSYNLSTQKDIPLSMLPEKSQKSAVYEVRIKDGQVVRRRSDRLTGNPVGLVKQIISQYSRNAVQSNSAVWGAKDPEFFVVANRIFKRYVYNKFVPNNSSIVDLGSGNGGDIPIWKEKGYSVIAVEPDHARYNILVSNVKSLVKIRCVQSKMEAYEFSERDYTYCTFMRSINAISIAERLALVSRLLAKRKKLVIVCSTLERARSVLKAADSEVTPLNVKSAMKSLKELERNLQTPKDVTSFSKIYKSSDDSRRIKFALKGRELTVDYERNSQGSDRIYSDQLMSIEEWKDLADSCNAKMTICEPEEFLESVYKSTSLVAMSPCKLDVGIMIST